MAHVIPTKLCLVSFPWRFLHRLPLDTKLVPVHSRQISRKLYKFPVLKEEDLVEQFVRGSGPGGQKINKTSNCVVLKHLPTGIVVKCQETRSQFDNRKKAREKLEEQVDVYLNQENSYLSQIRQEKSVSRQDQKQKSRKRLAMKLAFKDREGLE